MAEYLQFSLADMTPYNRQSWFNLIGEYNQAIWFIYPVAMAITLLLMALLFKPSKNNVNHLSVRWVLAILGLAWIWNGAVFHPQFFANLNWAAPWFGWLFIIQGCLWILIAFFMKSATWVMFNSLRGRLALGLIIVGIFAYPLSLFFEGRSFSQLEWFPVLPTPLLVISFAIIIVFNSPWRHFLVIIPLIWGIISAAFASTLGLLELHFISGAILIWLIHLVTVFFNHNGKTS